LALGGCAVKATLDKKVWHRTWDSQLGFRGRVDIFVALDLAV